MILSKKQINLYKDIVNPNIPNISVEGSVQSGKTYDICSALIEYAKNLNEYEKEQRKNSLYIPRNYYGAIIGWTTDTLNGNIVENIQNILDNEYHFKKDKDYVLKFGNQEKYLKIYNIKFYFFGFNTYLAFNKILGRPLIFVWVDESARIYSSQQLRETFDEIPGRQASFSGHPYYKRIDSFNVEGGESHPYKKAYIDGNNWKKYIFYPYDNPVLDTAEKIKEVVSVFPKGTLREQKIFNKWVVAEGRVFNKIPKISEKEFKEDYIIREIGIGCDYGSVNATTFSGIALAQNTKNRRWELILIDSYYHDPNVEGDTPTTEYYSNQLKCYITFLQKKYVGIKINTLVIDSEASHFDNRLEVDGIRHELAKKNNMSVDKSVQLMQSLFEKELLKKIEMPTIRYFINNGPVYAGHDVGLEELESYHYDKIKSEKEGINCYVKEFDHFVDGSRYVIMEFALTGRAPIV